MAPPLWHLCCFVFTLGSIEVSGTSSKMPAWRSRSALMVACMMMELSSSRANENSVWKLPAPSVIGGRKEAMWNSMMSSTPTSVPREGMDSTAEWLSQAEL